MRHSGIATRMTKLTAAHSEMAHAKAVSALADNDALWERHQDPWISGLIEEWTARGLQRIAAIRAAIMAKVHPQHGQTLSKATPPWHKWDTEEMARAQFALESKARADYTLDDWLALIDLLIQTYWPAGAIQSEADYLTIRSYFAGQLRVNLESLPSAAHLKATQIAHLASLLPATFTDIPPKLLTVRDAHILRFAAAQTANLITNLTETQRTKIKSVVLNGVRRITLGDRQGSWQTLGQELFDTFADLNRDWRRIAITETGNVTNSGFIAALPLGEQVRREEAYRGACRFCQAIRGQILRVVADDHEPKDWDTQVWPSKNNVGRSASPRKRVDGALMPRSPEEMWSIPAGTVHPNCRGSWSRIATTAPGMSKEYQMWLRGLLTSAGLPTPPPQKVPA